MMLYLPKEKIVINTFPEHDELLKKGNLKMQTQKWFPFMLTTTDPS